MSTFNGILHERELNFISIDCLEEHVHNCSAFFISHAHTDHIRGLFSPAFSSRINSSPDKLIYCSPLTAHIIIHHKKGGYIIPNKIKPVQLSSRITLYSPDDAVHQCPVFVTLLPAAHCPGSVLFLIEYKDKRILFTGDFRLTVANVRKFSQLTNSDGSAKKIHAMYLDNTFLNSVREVFPSRDESLTTIVKLITDWRVREPNCLIHLQLSAGFGYECLFSQLYRTFGCAIHVHKDEYELHYKYIEELDCCTTPHDGGFIHACLVNKKAQTCQYVSENRHRIRKIKLCVYLFSGTNEPNQIVRWMNENYTAARVCYSLHCSKNEILEFVRFFDPDKIIPIVVQPNDNTYDVVSSISSGNPLLKDSHSAKIWTDEKCTNGTTDNQRNYHEAKCRREKLYEKFDLNFTE